MDTFMDKLAQKLTAQEIIKANAAAETEELNQLRSQVKEYNACMLQLQEIGKGLHRNQEQLEGMLQGTFAQQIEKLVEEGLTRLDGAQVNGEEIDRLVQESIAKIQQMQQDTLMLEELKQQLEELKSRQEESLGSLGEDVHKECVKVYRNVQAAVVEENGKQNEAIKKAADTVQVKLNVVLGLSVAALLAAAGGILLQLLQYFQIM